MNAFKIFDDKEMGFIDSCKLRDIMQNMGDTLDDDEINLFIKQADIAGDGMVNYEEFTKRMFKNKSSKHKLRPHDKTI